MGQNWTNEVLNPVFQNILCKNYTKKTTDGSMGLNLSSLPKKGCLLGESHASDFVRPIPQNTLLTKVLNHYFELNFCRQCIYQ